jgi:hypothetical protein
MQPIHLTTERVRLAVFRIMVTDATRQISRANVCPTALTQVRGTGPYWARLGPPPTWESQSVSICSLLVLNLMISRDPKKLDDCKRPQAGWKAPKL